MKLSLHFYLLNEHFSPEYAEANFNGEESENNPKYEWEDELEIDHVKSFEILREGVLPLNGELPNGDSFSHEVSRMFLISIVNSDNQQAFLGVSESILADFKQEENVIRVYIKDYEPFGNPTPGVYIASKEFPKELIF
jgi:hypothetical protein